MKKLAIFCIFALVGCAKYHAGDWVEHKITHRKGVIVYVTENGDQSKYEVRVKDDADSSSHVWYQGEVKLVQGAEKE